MENYFTRMDTKLTNILNIRKGYHDEACILIVSYIDSLSNYSSSIMKEFPSKRKSKARFLRLVGDYSIAHNYLDCVIMYRIYDMRNRHAGCKVVYDKYKGIFDNFIDRVKNESQCGITEFLKKNDIEKIEGIKKYFDENKSEPHINLSDIYFSGYLYEFRSTCVHQYMNNFHNDFAKEPYYLYVPCVDGDDFISLEIPFEFLHIVLQDCYTKVKSEFNTKMKDSWIAKMFEEPTSCRPPSRKAHDLT